VDVGEYLGYSKPSVSRAMGILRSGGYIEVNPDGGLALTDSGLAIAEKIYERHTLLTRMLQYIGVDAETGAVYSNHHEKYDMDEDALHRASAVAAQIAADFLAQNA
jgi:Mn-dependent DtxR family transcriptional regulator